MDSEVRNDLHLTATGIGHSYKPGYGFPPPGFRRTFTKVLPPVIKEPEWLITDEDHFQTTTGSTHDYKFQGGQLSHPSYKKAPGSWKVHYVEDTIGKLAVKPWRRPLTMGNQCSEMKAKYTGLRGIDMNTVYNARVQPFNLSDHHLEGNSKSLVPSTINKYSAGQEFYPRDKGVITYHGDPYLTTTNRDHRAFTDLELGRYPKKQYATHWECEGYPKAWGHGSKHNPLPPDSVPREKGPMRDVTWFKSATKIPRLPLSMNPVPNKGMISLMKESYTDPPERKRWELFTCNVPKPWHSPLETPGKGETYLVPRMHHTEYRNYGSGKTVTV